jgi:aryl-alcohol dehydrogenase-like predicted oxidoreductase
MTDTTYRLLGRSGLRVSPLALGAMTFGEGGYHAGEDAARALFRDYVDAGGNVVDTAVNYAGGRSEELLGRFMRETGSRERLVVATKFAMPTGPSDPSDPNARGNGRKNIMASLDASLRRLGTDYVDLYWLHLWDGVTPVTEVMSTFDALVRSGRVRAVGLSNVPAWYAVRALAVAEAHGWEAPCALQLEYSLVERNIEREHVPAARELGLGIVPWSPLASGLLAGKYAPAHGSGSGVTGDDAGRLAVMERDGTFEAMRRTGNPALSKLLTERNWRIVAELRDCAAELERPMAEVALSWVMRRPGVVTTLVGATRPEQLRANLRAAELDLPGAVAERLERAGRPPKVYPYYFSGPDPALARPRA